MPYFPEPVEGRHLVSAEPLLRDKKGTCLVVGVLFYQPLGEFSEALFIADLRFVSEQTPCLREIGIAVANITSAVFVRDHRFNVFAQKTSKYLRNFTN